MIDDVSEVTLPAWPGQGRSSALGYSSGLLAQFGSSALGCSSALFVSSAVFYLYSCIPLLYKCCGTVVYCCDDVYLYQVPSSKRIGGASLVVSDGSWRGIASI